MIPRDVRIPEGWIEELVGDSGLTENEAYVCAFMAGVERLYGELPDVGVDAGSLRAGLRAAQDTLALRVVRRDYPDGWLTREEHGKD